MLLARAKLGIRRMSGFPHFTAATGLTLAKEYVENSVIEEDVASLLKYVRRYYDLIDVVEYGVTKIEHFLAEDGTDRVDVVRLPLWPLCVPTLM